MTDQTSFTHTKPLYTVDETAHAVGVSPWTIRAHGRNGSLKLVRVGRRVLISSETIDRIRREGLPSLGGAK
jgi:excisionase family DNA binding protein